MLLLLELLLGVLDQLVGHLGGIGEDGRLHAQLPETGPHNCEEGKANSSYKVLYMMLQLSHNHAKPRSEWWSVLCE